MYTVMLVRLTTFSSCCRLSSKHGGLPHGLRDSRLQVTVLLLKNLEKNIRNEDSMQ